MKDNGQHGCVGPEMGHYVRVVYPCRELFSTNSNMNESILCLAQDKAILPVHDVGMKLNLIYLSDDPNHATEFGGEAINVLVLDIMPH